MAKIIVASDTKAFRVEGVILRDEKYISIRQLYKKKKDTEWSFGKQGVNINAEVMGRVLRHVKTVVEEDKFKQVDLNKED